MATQDNSSEKMELACKRLSALFEQVKHEVSYTSDPKTLMGMFHRYGKVMFGPHLRGVHTKTLAVKAKANMCLVAEKRGQPVPLAELALAKQAWQRSVQQTIARLSGVDSELVDHSYEGLLIPFRVAAECVSTPTLMSGINVVAYTKNYVPVVDKSAVCSIVTDPEKSGGVVFVNQTLFVIPDTYAVNLHNQLFVRLGNESGLDVYAECSVRSEAFPRAVIYWVVDAGQFELYSASVPSAMITQWLPNVIRD